MSADVHQHLWPAAFVAELRRRTTPPCLDGWTLRTVGEPDYEVDAALHGDGGAAARAEAALAAGEDLVLIGPSSPLGLEWLPRAEAEPLLRAYHEGAAALPRPFAAWATACLSDPSADELAEALDGGFVGLQLPATALADAAGYRHCAPLLAVLEQRGAPLFVHPGASPAPAAFTPAGAPASAGPGWWPPLVDYVAQQHAAWFAFRAFGRPAHPCLRVCFAMLAGLAPLHGERSQARGGPGGAVDPLAFVETSSYGPRALDAVLRVLGVDVVAHGSDAPYAPPALPWLAETFGPAAAHAIGTANPARLIGAAGRPAHPTQEGQATT